MFPASLLPFFRNEAVLDRRDEMVWRVEGGTMSTRAESRSNRDSSSAAVESCDEMEDSEAEEEVREEEVDAYGE